MSNEALCDLPLVSKPDVSYPALATENTAQHISYRKAEGRMYVIMVGFSMTSILRCTGAVLAKGSCDTDRCLFL